MQIKRKSRINLTLFSINKKTKFDNDKEPLIKLVSDFKDLKTILETDNKLNIVKFFCFCKEIIHYILYNYEEIIHIYPNEQTKNLAYNTYLNILINDNLEIINYSYKLNYINEINNERQKTKDKYKLILFAKCIICLIDNFKQTDEFNDDEDIEILEKIENENKLIIKNNMDVFKNLGLSLNEKKIEIIKIDELYMEIIKALITNINIEDYEYTYNLLNQIELINIDLTKEMFNDLLKFINENEKNINDYLIMNKEDLFNDTKINFYFIFLKYILKNSIYIYQFKFLLKTKKIILEQLKLNKLYSIKTNKTFNEKFEYILKTLFDSEFYWDKYINIIKIIINQVLIYYKEYLFESKKQEIIAIEKKINNNENDFGIYLQDYELAKKMNLRAPIINYLYVYTNKSMIKNEEKFRNEVEIWERIEKMIVEHKIKKMSKNYRQILLNYINEEENNKKIIMKIFGQNHYEYFIKEGTKSLNKKNLNIEIAIENKNIINENHNDNIQIKKNENKFSIKDKQNNINQNNDIKVIENKNNVENYQAPSPAIKTSNNFDNIIMNILMKCIIILSTSKIRKEKFFIFQSILYGEYGIAITYEKLMEFKGVYIQRQNDNYLAKNFLLFLEFLKNFEDNIKEGFLHKYNLIIRLEFTKETNDNSTGSNIYNITCKYSFYNPIDNKPFIYKDENILINGINSNYQGFYFMLSDINNDIYTNIKYKEYHPENQTGKVKSKNENIKNSKDSTINISKNNNNKCENNENNQEILFNIIDESTKMKSYCNNSLFNSNSSKYNIINFINIIGKHENSADVIIL